MKIGEKNNIQYEFKFAEKKAVSKNKNSKLTYIAGGFIGIVIIAAIVVVFTQKKNNNV